MENLIKLSDFQVILQRRVSSKGIRYVHFYRPGAPISLKICSRGGSRFDPVGQSGLAHFAEHLLFDGSDKFANKKELALSFDDLGASFSGGTTHESTSVDFLIAKKDHLEFISEVVNQIFNHSKLSEKDIELERNIIKTEISSKMDTPQRLLFLGMMSLLYPNSTLANNVSGTEESVNSIKRDDIMAYLNNQLLWNRTVVTCGDCDLKEIYTLFDPLLKNNSLNVSTQLPVFSQNKRCGVTTMLEQKLIHCSIALPTSGIDSTDAAPLNVIATYLGKGRASLLKDILRYNEGLLYSISAGNERYSDTGFFYINFSIKKDNLFLVLSKISEILQKFIREGIDPKDLQTVKNKVVNSGIIPTQTVQFWVSTHFYRELLNKDNQDTYVDFLNEISAMQKTQIDAVIKKYFSLDKLYFYVVGNIAESEVADAFNAVTQAH